ncbi:MAG: VWA domain-containing protein [Prevotella sp.]|nr:VWA domain-containing protein [Prevotella sp.]MDY4218610.1 VWA domain-containing protein [Prevotella sp.]
MFRFENPTYLYLLLLIPLLAALFYVGRRIRRKQLERFGDMVLLKQLSPNYSIRRPYIKIALSLAALTTLIIVAARPQTEGNTGERTEEGIEMMVALDISNSMLAQDVAPSRLEKSKMMVQNLVDHFSNNKIGLIVFAGEAYVQLPITADRVSAKMFLNNADPSLIEAQGTNLSDAIDLAMNSFTKDERMGKALVIITDGEDHDGDAEAMAKKAKEKGIKVFVLGVGTNEGAPIPTEDGGYLTDRSGNTVMTRLNETMCREVAAAGDGAYLHLDNSFLAEQQLKIQLDKLRKVTIRSGQTRGYEEQFQAFAIICLIFLCMEAIIKEVKNPIIQRWQIFKERFG